MNRNPNPPSSFSDKICGVTGSENSCSKKELDEVHICGPTNVCAALCSVFGRIDRLLNANFGITTASCHHHVSYIRKDQTEQLWRTKMRNSERLQHEMDTTLEEVEAFLHDLSYADLSDNHSSRRQKLESKVKQLRAKYHLHLQRIPFSSLRLLNEPFPKDLELKRPRSFTSPDHLFLPDVPEEEDDVTISGNGNQRRPGKVMEDNCFKDDVNFNTNRRPRSSSFPLSL